MYLLIGLAILLGAAAVALTLGWALHKAGVLANVGTDKTEVKAAVVASREAVRRRVAEARRINAGH